jgi:hypothetical protein
MERLSICNNIVNIADSMVTVKAKAAETLEVQFSLPWRNWDLLIGSNLYMEGTGTKYAKEFFKVDRQVLLPKEIILVQRFADQHRLVSNMPNDMLELESEGLTPISALSKQLQEIAVRSCYDQGNINYDTKRVYSTSLGIVKVLESLNEDFTILTLADQESKITVKQMLMNDLVGQGWGKELPELNVPT